MKQAIVVISFGTTVLSARQENINPLVHKVSEKYPSYDVFLAFTSKIIVKRLRDRGESIDTELGCLEKLIANGYTKIIVQPTHLIGGEEFDKLKHTILGLADLENQVDIKVGRPLLYFMGQDERPDDYQILIDTFIKKLEIPKGEGLALIGHGGTSVGNASYSVLQLKLCQSGYDLVRLANLESYPQIDDTLVPWQEFGTSKPERLHVHPLLLVAGDHVLNDIFGDASEAIAQKLTKEGYEVIPHAKGLGAYECIQDIYIQHLADAMDGKYEGRSKHRPTIPDIK